MTEPGAPPTADELAELEQQVSTALAAGDASSLPVLGFGEISVALGWPQEQPRWVCKRMPPFRPEALADYQALIERYVAAVRDIGTDVVDTTVVGVPRGGEQLGYLVQPLLPSDSLGERVLAAATPDAEHPFLTAVIDRVAEVNDRVSVDAQIANWSWNGERPMLLDVGTPFLWDDGGRSRLDMDPFLVMLPQVVRPLVRRDLNKLLERWRRPRGVALDLVANLYREGMEDWVEPALVICNHRLDVGSSPLRMEEARALYEEDAETWPRLKRLQVAQRAWQTRVRRRPYDFFIQSGYGNTMR